MKNIIKYNFYVVILFLFATYSWANDPIVDDYGNTISESTPVNFNTNISGRIETSGDVDWFTFTLLESKSIDIYYSGTDTTYITLYDSNQNEIEEIYSDSDHIIVNLSPNDYYVTASQFAQNINSYALRIDMGDVILDDYGDAPNKASSIDFNVDTEGQIETSGDVDWFTFTLSESKSVDIYYSGGDTTYITLYDSNQNEIGEIFLDSDHLITNLAIGTYYVTASQFSNNINSYSVRIDLKDIVTDDYGNTINEAALVDFDTDINGQIETIGDVDFFKFNVDKLTTFEIYYISNDATYIRLHDSFGNEMEEIFLDSDRLTMELAPGVYYVSASQFSDNFNLYTLRIDLQDAAVDDYGDAPNEATSINFNVDIEGQIEKSNDQDWFKFTLSESKSVAINYSGSDTTYITLYNSNEYEIEEIYSDSDYIIVNLSSGVYYVAASQFSDNINSYAFRVDVSETINDDYGDTLSEAEPAPFNTDINGSIETSGDADFFKFTLSKLGSVDIYYSGSDTTYIRLYDSFENEIEYIYSDSDHIILNLSPDVYYVSASQFAQNINSYTLRIDAENTVVDDYGNTRDEAVSVALNSDIHGQIEANDDVDFFKFTIAKPSNVDIYCSGTAPVNVKLYNSSGDEIMQAASEHITDKLFPDVYFVSVSQYDQSLGEYNLIINMHILGDVNGDELVDLSDAVAALQTCSGIITSISSGSDVNHDNRIGLEEVLYIFKMISD